MLPPRMSVLLLACLLYETRAEVDLITEPRPGEEYVLVSGGQERAISFETSHKIPEKLPTHHVSRPHASAHDSAKKSIKNHAGPVIDALAHENHKSYTSEGIVSIEEDKKPKKSSKDKATEAIQIEVPASKHEQIKIKDTVNETDTNPEMSVDLEAMAESGKLSEGTGTTTQKPVLTTPRAFDAIPINFDSIDDINSGLLASDVKFETAGSEQKQHSRIQIKKGPNGQDYEYEYIYYYEDEEEDSTKPKDSKKIETAEPIHNSHDGPGKEHDNHIAKTASTDSKYTKYSSIERTTTAQAVPAVTTAAAPEAQNEILPAGQRTRYRGRNLPPAPVEEEINEERLPASTRFPPRSRNLNTNPAETTSEPAKQRGRPQFDNTPDESIGQSRSRTRAHVRRPSSELVDLASFNTHSSDIPLSQYKELPSRFSAEGKTGSEAVEPSKPVVSSPVDEPEVHPEADSHREAHRLSAGAKVQEIIDDAKTVDVKHTTASYFDRETTEYTTMMAMEKVALDLYAYLAGEKLNNEINPIGDSLMNFDGTTTDYPEDTTGSTTELTSTTEEATTVVTTTTTTTTPAPITTTTTTTPAPAPTRPQRFKGPNRNGGRRVTLASTAATEAPAETSTKRGRFNRPSFGRRASTPAPSQDSPVEEVVNKQETSQVSSAPKPLSSRARFGGRRGLTTSATAAPSTAAPQDGAPEAEQTQRPRVRPSFLHPGRRPLPGATSTTTAPSSDAAPVNAAPASSAPDAAQEETSEAPVAPARGIGRGRLPGLRPLRPGPRLNIGRGATTSAAASPVTEANEANVAEHAEEHHEEASVEPTEVTSANPLQRLRGRPRLQLTASPKPKVAPATPIRRPNPLISRRRPAAETSEAPTESPEAAATEVSEISTGSDDITKETAAEPHETPAETTPAPRALSSLLARRRLVQRRPGKPT